jgi:hypothetical protein
VFALILLQTTQPSAWTPEAVGLFIIPALVSGVIAILSWWSSRRAHLKLNAMARDIVALPQPTPRTDKIVETLK